MTCGIYCIKNITNNKVYIGQSVNIEKRLAYHKAHLRHNTHWNKYLQNSWNKYEEKCFEFSIIEIVYEDELSKSEQKWILECNSIDKKMGYNKTYGGEGGCPTDEVRKVMSEKAKGRLGYWKGKVIPEEAKRNMSEAAKKRGCCKPTKKVIHLETGVIYNSCAEAARTLFPNILSSGDGIFKVASGDRNRYYGTTWRFIDE